VLRHVLVVGGSQEGWLGFGGARWQERVGSFAATVADLGVPWLTIRPVEGHLDTVDLDRLTVRVASVTGGEVTPAGVVVSSLPGVTVLVAPRVDGHQRIADAVTTLAARGVPSAEIDEAAMVATLLAPSGAEPDLVVILGPPTRLPPSLVWELAYAELVFLDLPWETLDVTHLELAVDDFRRRDRRFGGIDA
jgi:undecaprenyl diphosphate synthase